MLYDNVTSALTGAYYDKTRIRVFYGDTQTGKEWLETNDIIGYIGVSKIKNRYNFILLPYKNSKYGTPVLINNIVKITVNHKTVYQNAKYKIPEFYIEETTLNNKPWFYLYMQGETVPYFGNAKKRKLRK